MVAPTSGFMGSRLGNQYVNCCQLFIPWFHFTDGRLSYSGEACQGQTLAMECPEGYTMTFTEAFYGRDDPNYCKGDDPEMNKVTNCSQPDVLDAVKAICDGRTICDLEVDNQNLGGNPCRDVPKFLVVRFYCAGMTFMFCSSPYQTWFIT